MRTPEDAIKVRNSIEAGEIKRAVVVGGGFIGLEVAKIWLSEELEFLSSIWQVKYSPALKQR